MARRSSASSHACRRPVPMTRGADERPGRPDLTGHGQAPHPPGLASKRAMNRTAAILRRALNLILALTPLLAGADLCTVGALTGRADLACGMVVAAPASCAVPAARCSHCAPAAPVKETPRPHGPTCCDLRPQAEGAAGQPGLVPPLPVAHAAAASVAVSPVVVVASPFGVASDDGRAPPADLPPSLFPRAPPLG